MTAFLRRWWRRATGPLGRRLLLVLAVCGVWLAWTITPPLPLRDWTTVSAVPATVMFALPNGSTKLSPG